jgi:alkylation response protein AidB-like acyl-CoA dehydrogenase
MGFASDELLKHFYDIFEGTEQIQQLVIARALSGMRIE